MLVVARTADAGPEAQPCLFVVPTDAPGFEAQPIQMEIVAPEQQFKLFFDDVRLPARRARRRRGRRAHAAVRRAQPRADHGGVVLHGPGALRARQGGRPTPRSARFRRARSAPTRRIAHPLAQSKIEIELARLMTQKAAALYDAGDDMGRVRPPTWPSTPRRRRPATPPTGRCRPMAATGWPGVRLAGLLVAARPGRIAPVSREMILNFVAMHSLGLPKSY